MDDDFILAGSELAIAYRQTVLDTMAAAAELASITPLERSQRQRGCTATI
jgi:hypothetical protein